MIAGLGKDPLQKMAVVYEVRGCEELLLKLRFDPGDPEVKELALVFQFFAELIDLVEPGLQLRIVLVLLGPEPKVIPFIAVGAILPLPRFILVQRLPQDCRIFKIIGAVLPGVDERSALFLDELPFNLDPRIVISAKRGFRFQTALPIFNGFF